MDKEMRKLAKALRSQGFDVEVTAKQHLMVSRNGRLIVTFSGSPKDWRAIRNALAPLRRAGFRWPPR